MELLSRLNEFADEISIGRIEVYNEASIQHELAIYLRGHLGDKYKIQLERNIDYFGLDKVNYLKKEMDIIVFTSDKMEKHCIELKFPTRGQVPEQMFKACKDIKFLEQLMNAGFGNSYFMMFADNRLFCIGEGKEGIYKMWREERLIKGGIRKPTGKKDEILYFDRQYTINWQSLIDNLNYFIIEVSPKII